MYPQPCTATPFGGVENDLNVFWKISTRIDGNPAWLAFLATCYVVDLPLSLVGDCLTLPLVLGGAFDKPSPEGDASAASQPLGGSHPTSDHP